MKERDMDTQKLRVSKAPRPPLGVKKLNAEAPRVSSGRKGPLPRRGDRGLADWMPSGTLTKQPLRVPVRRTWNRVRYALLVTSEHPHCLGLVTRSDQKDVKKCTTCTRNLSLLISFRPTLTRKCREKAGNRRPFEPGGNLLPMPHATFADLDELIERCRNSNSRHFLAEAVACYRAGAYRGAILLAWEAVVFDVIAKVRDLAASGDNAAIQLEEFIKSLDEGSTAQFEREILQKIEGFEFLDLHQTRELQRLRVDRNQSAHPSMNKDWEPYQPSAEAARYHIRNTVEHLLAHPPIQGKAAMSYLKQDLLSEYFPEQWREAKAHLARGPLKHAKANLVRDWLKMLLKCAFGLTDTSGIANNKLLAAIRATRELYPEEVQRLLESYLDDLVERLRRQHQGGPNRWLKALVVLRLLPGAYDCLTEPTRAYLLGYLMSSERGRAKRIHQAMHIEGLREIATDEIPKLEFTDFFELVELNPTRDLIEQALMRLRAAGNWGYSGLMLRHVVIPHLELLSDEDLNHIFESAKQNNQVSGSFDYPKILEHLRVHDRPTPEESDTDQLISHSPASSD